MIFFPCKLEVECELKLRFRIPLPGQEVHDQTILDCKDTVIVDMWVSLVEKLRNEGLEARSGDHYMDVCWPHGMAV